MPAAYLSLGANIGDREHTIGRALKLIAASPGIQLIRVSPFYSTEPVGYKDQPTFINCAAKIESGLSPERLLGRLRAIERALGRTPRIKWREREIDIDVLLYGDVIVNTSGLQVPHPEMQNRRFVLAPLADIAPEVIHPIFKKSISALLDECGDISEVVRVANSSGEVLE